MLISVDLPAPFSPSRACTSPRRRSKSMWSFASTPGNCLVIPRSSRTGGSSMPAGFYEGPGRRVASTRSIRESAAHFSRASLDLRFARCRKRAGSKSPPFSENPDDLLAADRERRLDLAADDLLLEGIDLREPSLLQLGLLAELAKGDSAVLQVEDEVASTLVALAALRALDSQEDPLVDSLHRTGEDVGAEERLVDVDADRPLAGFLGRVERTETARTGNAEHDLRPRVELVLSHALALGLIDEVLRVPDLDRRAWDALLCAGLVPGEERVDRRDLDAADDADVLLALRGRDVCREAADQVAVLLCRVRQALDVRVLALETGDRHVGDRELRVRELVGYVLGRICEQEARRDHDVVATPRERGHVRQVVTCGTGLDRAVLDLQHLGRPLHSRQLILVEPLVVETADVADQPSLERRLGCRSAARCKAHRHENDGDKGCEPERHQSMLAQNAPPPRDPPIHQGRC